MYEVISILGALILAGIIYWFLWKLYKFEKHYMEEQ